jgi:hypothetical protein
MPTDVCSPNSSGQKPKPQPLPQPDAKSRGVKHAAVYGCPNSRPSLRHRPGVPDGDYRARRAGKPQPELAGLDPPSVLFS